MRFVLNQTGFEKGATFGLFSSYKANVKHAFSNKISIRAIVLPVLVLGVIGLSHGASPESPTGKRGKKAPVLRKPAESPAVSGIILAFHQWPDEKEKALILKKTAEKGLKKTKTISLSKLWVFEWDKPKTVLMAELICLNFPKTPSLKYCEPDHPLFPQDASVIPSLIHQNKNSCDLAKDHDIYWAQDMIGADLIREELKKKNPKNKIFIAIFDTPVATNDGKTTHDIAVKNLVAGKGKQAVLPERGRQGQALRVFHIKSSSTVADHIDRFETQARLACRKTGFSGPKYEECLRKAYPHYINFSMGPDTDLEDISWSAYQQNYNEEEKKELSAEIKFQLGKKPEESLTDEEIKSFFQQLREQVKDHYNKTTSHAFKKVSPYATIIQAAGNSASHDNTSVFSQVVRHSKESSVIIVGNLSPNGTKNKYSQEHPEVHIMAPAGNSIHTVDAFGNIVSFGGTSAAAPLVTGSLSAFDWMSGYHPTAKEAKILLEKTAVPHMYSNDSPRTNGAGMVNAYKLGMVGKELNKICKKDRACYKRMIKMDTTYDTLFPPDQGLNKALESGFPECSQTVCADPDFSAYPAECSDKKEIFKRLRKQAFLQTKDKELWRWVSCIYAGYGFGESSEGAIKTYISLAEPDTGHDSASSCRTDADCVLIPECPGSLSATGASQLKFQPANQIMSERYYNVEYYNKCGKKPKCRDKKCRCGQEERVKGEEKTDPKTGQKTIHYTDYQAKCIGVECKMKTDTITETEPVKNAKKPAVPSSGPRQPSGPASGPATGLTKQDSSGPGATR